MRKKNISKTQLKHSCIYFYCDMSILKPLTTLITEYYWCLLNAGKCKPRAAVQLVKMSRILEYRCVVFFSFFFFIAFTNVKFENCLRHLITAYYWCFINIRKCNPTPREKWVKMAQSLRHGVVLYSLIFSYLNIKFETAYAMTTAHCWRLHQFVVKSAKSLLFKH